MQKYDNISIKYTLSTYVYKTIIKLSTNLLNTVRGLQEKLHQIIIY